MPNSKLLFVTLVAMTVLLTRGVLGANDGDRFDSIDTNRDGLITPAELKDGLGVGVDLTVANNYVSTVDADKDGKLNREEFANLMPESHI
ncbi:hypothetical protein ACROYT_G034276 [Oculina patagonica]